MLIIIFTIWKFPEMVVPIYIIDHPCYLRMFHSKPIILKIPHGYGKPLMAFWGGHHHLPWAHSPSDHWASSVAPSSLRPPKWFQVFQVRKHASLRCVTWFSLVSCPDMEVSLYSGTHKSPISMGFSLINHPFLGPSIYGNHHNVNTRNSGNQLTFCTAPYLRLDFLPASL